MQPRLPAPSRPAATSRPADEYLDLAGILALLRKHLVAIVAIALPVALIGLVYALMAPPAYQANLLIKVDVNDPAQRNIPSNLAGIFDLKTAAAAELEMLRSRSVVTRAVESAHLYINAKPKYVPLVGEWMARRSDEVSGFSVPGFSGYAWGAEAIEVSRFDVPKAFEKKAFTLTLVSPTSFKLHFDDLVHVEGLVGKETTLSTPAGDFVVKVDSVKARPGAQFVLRRFSMEDAVERLQKALVIAERGKQSGLISVSLEDANPALAARVLNQIGEQYIAQNVNLKTEEAEKSLAFLETQLPELKTAIETAEARYNTFRNSRGTTDLNEEVKSILQQSVQAQVRLVELRQRQDELRTRYQDENPLVQAVAQQIRTVSAEIGSVNEKIRRVPATEQDLVRLTRDVRVNTELYASLLSTAQQLRLVRASTIGSARLIDTAVEPSTPVGPKRPLIAGGAAVAGLLLGLLFAVVRSALTRSIDTPDELGRAQGLPVAAVVPHSKAQSSLQHQILGRGKKVNLLSDEASDDGAIESLRTFRTSLQHAKAGARNNIVAITGPTASIGKSFIAANLAALLASSGKRVLLIDADLRDGYLHRYLGLERRKGLSELLAGQAQLPEAAHLNVLKNLDFIATGELRARPADALANGVLGDMLARIAPSYDFVLIDTAPVLAGADALIVSSHAGLVFCIARRGTSRADQLAETINRFDLSGIEVAGLIFNDAKPTDLAYGYGYEHHVGRRAA
ncbi:putative tyrosine-protein kinase EpsB [Burkholderiales bacterium 8X]|nr:putative tyrosine-protein kinase EpsB [Burkholderiales bacterium 8X]